MKNRVIQGFLLVASLLPSVCLAAAPAASTSVPALKAIMPADNDITPDADAHLATAPIPEGIAKEFTKIVTATYTERMKSDYCKHAGCDLKRDSMFGPIFQLKTPNGMNLYVFKLLDVAEQSAYYFVMEDPKSGKFSPKPFGIYGYWLDGFYKTNDELAPKKPLVSFSNVNGKMLVVAENFAHNGNVYNAIVYHYLSIGDDLSLKPMLALEAKSQWSFGADEDSFGILTRELKFIDEKTATITCYLQPYKSGAPRRLIGTVKIGTDEDGTPFRVIKKIIVDTSLISGALITVNDDDEDNHFLATGGDVPFLDTLGAK